MRPIYFMYYVKQLEMDKFKKWFAYVRKEKGMSALMLYWNILSSSLMYNISILEYFQFRFFGITSKERDNWAGSGCLYEYQKQMNPKATREVLENKISFLRHFQQFVKRRFADLVSLKTQNNLSIQMLGNPSGRLVLKCSRGQAGREVEVVKCSDYTPETLLRTMNAKGYDLAEEYVLQHPALMELSPSGVNTVRIVTQLYRGRVEFFGARLRVSVNSSVDNMAAGNLAAPVDLDTGVVVGPGVYNDISKNDEATHPVTGKTIVGFAIPFWQETMQMVVKAAMLTPENRSVGWDVAITSVGPELIEGNHNWCKLLWQLPVKKGLKPMLKKYLQG
jgi:hypothetical protein